MAEDKRDFLPASPGRQIAGPGSGATPPVESPGASNPAGNGPAPAGAASSVPQYGGNRSGKRRADGLPPGSAEAVEADRKKDRERKQRVREAAHRQIQAPALPSIHSGTRDPASPVSNGQNFALGSSPGGAPAGLAEPSGEELVPWDPEMLEGLFGEAIELSERRRVAKFKEAAQAAQLPDAVVRQIANDAQFPAAFKASTSRHGPKAIAKTLNRFGVSAKYSDEGIFAFSILAILYQGWRLKAGLDELIERANKERKERQAAAQAQARTAEQSK